MGQLHHANRDCLPDRRLDLFDLSNLIARRQELCCPNFELLLWNPNLSVSKSLARPYTLTHHTHFDTLRQFKIKVSMPDPRIFLV